MFSAVVGDEKPRIRWITQVIDSKTNMLRGWMVVKQASSRRPAQLQRRDRRDGWEIPLALTRKWMPLKNLLGIDAIWLSLFLPVPIWPPTAATRDHDHATWTAPAAPWSIDAMEAAAAHEAHIKAIVAIVPHHVQQAQDVLSAALLLPGLRSGCRTRPLHLPAKAVARRRAAAERLAALLLASGVAAGRATASGTCTCARWRAAGRTEESGRGRGI